jgi:hypothetical protein
MGATAKPTVLDAKASHRKNASSIVDNAHQKLRVSSHLADLVALDHILYLFDNVMCTHRKRRRIKNEGEKGSESACTTACFSPVTSSTRPEP